MWESEGLGNEDMLWASIAFNGGIAGQQEAPCGVVSSATVCLGLRHRCPIENKEMAKQARLDARQDANEFVQGFKDKFGCITCLGLLGISFSDDEGSRTLRESGEQRAKCDSYLIYTIEKLYELAGE
ncbi:MAG: C_GCAxxG_C_C family protein [Dehalococcoidales bacterium]|nr:MAG: C_GCAxxG_C_C family protein [Dehalococcoidales bacterium]